jgi:hypothetical protein
MNAITVYKHLKHISGGVYSLLGAQLTIRGVPIVEDIAELFIAFQAIRNIPNVSSIFERDRLIVYCKGKTIQFKRISRCLYSYVIYNRLIDGTGKYIYNHYSEGSINFNKVRRFVLDTI